MLNDFSYSCEAFEYLPNRLKSIYFANINYFLDPSINLQNLIFLPKVNFFIQHIHLSNIILLL